MILFSEEDQLGDPVVEQEIELLGLEGHVALDVGSTV